VTFAPVAFVECDPARARVFENGWSSFGPSTVHAATATSPRPSLRVYEMSTFRADTPAPPTGFQGEGLLAVDPGDGGPVHLFAAPDARVECPSIRAVAEDRGVRVTADGVVEHTQDDGPGGLESALARWADRYAAALGVRVAENYPTGWCPWYQYFSKLTERDMYENIDAIDAHELPIDMIAVDDAFQKEIGDWLQLSDRFSSLGGLVDRIHASDRRAGVWIAPMFVGARSDVYRDHPDWLVRTEDGSEPLWTGHIWEQDLYALDVTHPGAAAYLREVFQTWRGHGFDYFKLDFLFAGARVGRRHEDVTALEAYAMGVDLIRDAVGEDATLLGCGAPLLPSVGLFEGMRISCDIAPAYAPEDGDISQPSQAGAVLSGRGRAFMHGRFWHNDPDCVILRPEVERRAEWARHIETYSGVRVLSDRVNSLDAWGLETARRLLTRSTPQPLIPSMP
jgi:alpha-galactosidase